jgi:hypothetical protein
MYKSTFEQVFTQLDILYDPEKCLVSGMTPRHPERGECFLVKMHETRMEIIRLKYPEQDQCCMRGSEILIKLYEVARKLGVLSISVSDYSEIPANDPDKEPICFYRYYILLHGVSWYNTFGYFSDEYDKEVPHNLALIHSPINVYDKFREYQLLYKYFSQTELDTMTLYDVMSALDKLWRSNNRDEELYDLLQFIVLEPPIKYKSCSLHLEVKHVDTVFLYKKLAELTHPSRTQ